MRLLYEKEPNPVARIIAARSLQVGLPASVLFAALWPWIAKNELWPAAAGGSAAVFLGLSASFFATFNPRFGWGYPILSQLPETSANSGNGVALTFDDGPYPETTPHLLRILAEHDATATFFLVGERAGRWPNLTRAIIEAGHTIGLHGFRHRTMALLSATQIAQNLHDTAHSIESAAGIALPSRLLRPPYGFTTRTLCRTAHRMGYQMAAWSIDPRDYDPVGGLAIAHRVCAQLQPRSIVLLHERPAETATLDALPIILQQAHRRDLRCVGL